MTQEGSDGDFTTDLEVARGSETPHESGSSHTKTGTLKWEISLESRRRLLSKTFVLSLLRRKGGF